MQVSEILIDVGLGLTLLERLTRVAPDLVAIWRTNGKVGDNDLDFGALLPRPMADLRAEVSGPAPSATKSQ